MTTCYASLDTALDRTINKSVTVDNGQIDQTGPGGSARRLHHMGTTQISTDGVKGRSRYRCASYLNARNTINANDNVAFEEVRLAA